MTSISKKDVLKKEGCCVQCLKEGHWSYSRKSNKKCVMCGKQHLELMCPELMLSQNVCRKLFCKLDGEANGR
jgi:hypothetical protein